MIKHNATQKILFLLILGIALGCVSSTGWAASYYVDATSGSDSNTGTQTAPFRTVAKVNNMTLQAGDNVFFKAGGVWSELLVPRSGTGSAYISYGAYGTGNKPRMLNFQSSGKSYIKATGLEFRNGNNYQAVNIYNSSHHIVIDGCTITADTTNSANAAAYIRDSHHITIRNSVLNHLNLNSQGDALILHRNAQYCLIENNQVGSATHYALTLQGSDALAPTAEAKFNVIRNNVINNPNGALMELQSNSNYNLVEGNIVSGGKSTSYDVYLPRSLKTVCLYNVIRNNIFKNNNTTTSSGIAMEVYAYNNDPPNKAVGNHIYNNLVTNIGKSPVVIATNGDAGATANNNHFKNNIVYNNTPSYQLSVMKSTTIYDNFFQNNIFYKSGVTSVLQVQGVTGSVATIEKNDPTHFGGNLQVDPQLGTNFNPMTGSPCIDAGDFLTKVTSASGTGNVLVVADASYFIDGFGIAAGDTIRVGNSTATVTSVNRSTNTLTLAQTITWQNGAPVSLPYSGTKPDIGPYEYKSTQLSAPQGVQFN